MIEMREQLQDVPAVSHEPTFIEGSENIYADLGLDDPEMELARDRLARRLIDEIKARGLTLEAAATQLAVDEPTLFSILDGQLHGVSIYTLMTHLTKFGHDVTIVVRPKSEKHPSGRIEVEDELAMAGQSAVRPPST